MDETSPAEVPDLPPQPADPDGRIGPYTVLGPIGRGGSASVLVVEEEGGRRLALKLLHPVADDEAVRSRFRREFRALQRLSHPNVLEVVSWGIHKGRPWFTMELVDGIDLRDLMTSWASLPPVDRFARVRDLLVQVARALTYIHERGLVHRDVSPGNLIVARDGTVKLADFGLVTDDHADLTTAGTILGTVAHSAPEQLRGDRIDGRADLYALGTVMYQLLTGRKPFNAHTVQGWIDKHLHETPREPAELDPLVPEALNRVCMRLLQKDPNDRFASAMHLLRVLGDSDPMPESELWPPRAVGRSSVTAWVERTLDDVCAGRPGGALLLTGASGSGKSRILDDVDRAARRQGLAVGRGHARAFDRAFSGFRPIYQALVRGEVPEILRNTFDGDLPAPTERYPVIAALRELIQHRGPCVILLDGLERADGATREVVEYLVRNLLDLGEVPVAFVLTWETSDELPVVPLAALSAVRHEHLGPLTQSEVEELVLSVLPSDRGSAALAQRLHAETAGSPAYIADMLRGLVDSGILRRGRQRWELTVPPDEISNSRLPLPDKLRAVLQARVTPLSPQAWRVGRALAASRGPLDLDVLFDVVDDPEDDVMAGLDELVDAAIVTERRRDDIELAELSHARFRDILLDDLEPEALRALHGRVADTVARTSALRQVPPWETLAWHYERSDTPEKAFAPLVRTAGVRLERTLYDDALAFAERAITLDARLQLGPTVAHDRAEVLLTRTRALYHLGHWDDALASGRAAVAAAEVEGEPALLSRTNTRLGYILRNMGQLAEAETVLVRALTHADEAGDPTLLPRPTYHLGAVAFRRSDVVLAEERWSRALQQAQDAHVRRAEGMAHNGLGLVAITRGQADIARQELELAAEIFQDVGMRDYLTFARVNLLELYVPSGMFRRAASMVEQIIAQGRELAHPLSVTLGLIWHARLQRIIGRADLAVRVATEALRIAGELGAADEQVTALETLARAHLDLGSHDDALAYVETLLQVRERAGAADPTEAVRMLEARARAASGDVAGAGALLDDTEADQEVLQVRITSHLDAADAETLLGRTEMAAARLLRIEAAASSAGFRWLTLEALHRLAMAAPHEEARAVAARKAHSLARSLAGGLERDDADAFLERGWGLARP